MMQLLWSSLVGIDLLQSSLLPYDVVQFNLVCVCLFRPLKNRLV